MINRKITQDAVPVYPFTEDGPEPYAIKVLVSPDKTWTGYYHFPASLTFCFPTSEEI